MQTCSRGLSVVCRFIPLYVDNNNGCTMRLLLTESLARLLQVDIISADCDEVYSVFFVDVTEHQLCDDCETTCRARDALVQRAGD